jgi:hypothetical protein
MLVLDMRVWAGWQRMFGCQGAGVQLSAGQQLVVRVLQGPAGWWRVQVPHPEQEACHSAGRTQHAAATFLQTSTHALALACMLQRPLASCNVLACMARLAQAVAQRDVRATHVVPCHASRLVWRFKMCEQAQMTAAAMPTRWHRAVHAQASIASVRRCWSSHACSNTYSALP